MKTAITIIAAAAALAPAAASAQVHDHVHARSAARQPLNAAAAGNAPQVRPRARAEARAEQNRRDYREEQSEKISRTLKIGASGELDLSNLSGDIVITRGGGSSVQVEALKTARARTADEAREALGLVNVEFAERGSRAEVKTIYPRNDGQQRRNVNVSVQYTVTAPENTRISAQSLSGHISATGIKGDLNLETLSGNVVVDNAARLATAKSKSGNVTITNLRSDVGLEAGSVSGNVVIRQSSARRMELDSVSGDLTIADVTCDHFEAQTLSGSIEFASALQRDGRYELNAHSGVIRILPKGNVGFELEASSFSGDIQTDLELQNASQNSSGMGRRRAAGRMRSLAGTYGDGSAVLEVTTFSGTVILGKK